MKKILLYIISLLSLTACIRDDQPSQDSFALKTGDPLPFFTLSSGSDEKFSSEELKNKYALIIFFSTTCSDCVNAFPEIADLYHTYENDSSVQVLLIARDETQEQVAAYFTRHQYEMAFYTDPNRKVYSLFADNTIPRLFLADKNGTIILTQTEKIDAKNIHTTITK